MDKIDKMVAELIKDIDKVNEKLRGGKCPEPDCHYWEGVRDAYISDAGKLFVISLELRGD